MKNKRLIISAALFFTLVCLSASHLVGRAQAKGQEVVMGDFSVPHISGWKPDVYRGDYTNRINYTIEVDKTKLLLSFRYLKTAKGLKAPTAASLRQIELLRQETFKQMSRDAHSKTTYKTLAAQPTRFRSWPAYLVVVRSSSKRPVNKSVTNTKVLKFVDGKNEYWFSISLSGKSYSNRAQKIADAAWRDLTTGLKRRK